MIRNILKVFCLIMIPVVVSCRAGRIPAGSSPAVMNSNAETYIATYGDLAVREMKRSGVPASITLAQGMLESDYGRSTLARMGNNHFGIKCHNGWKGKTISQHDDRRNECFRKYDRPEESYYDHSDFLRTGTRYSFLFQIDPLDYKAWAHGLKRAGYATNPQYANLLIKKIEENKLYLYDQGNVNPSPLRASKNGSAQAPVPQPEKAASAALETAQKQEQPGTGAVTTITFGDLMARAPRIRENNRVEYIIVKEGETREKLETEFQLLRRDLARFNDLPEDFKPVAGQMLYIAPKKDKAEQGKEFHTVEAGETLHSIAQKYGVRLKSLLEMNGMTDSTRLSGGQKILLQEVRSPD